jgi:death-on-curing protein
MGHKAGAFRVWSMAVVAVARRCHYLWKRLDVPDRILKMTKASTTTTQVNGGFITREERTGKFVEVRTDKGTSRSSEKTVAAAKLAAELDRDALARLAKR